jgi:hypothetical protein
MEFVDRRAGWPEKIPHLLIILYCVVMFAGGLFWREAGMPGGGAERSSPLLACPMRMTTGLPCPLCGMTTGTFYIMRGQFVSAFQAHPFSLVLFAAAFLLFPLSVYTLATNKYPGLSRKTVLIITVFSVSSFLASWVYNLARWY